MRSCLTHWIVMPLCSESKGRQLCASLVLPATGLTLVALQMPVPLALRLLSFPTEVCWKAGFSAFFPTGRKSHLREPLVFLAIGHLLSFRHIIVIRLLHHAYNINLKRLLNSWTKIWWFNCSVLLLFYKLNLLNKRKTKQTSSFSSVKMTKMFLSDFNIFSN